ncbi:MAG: NAD-binding protein, partial [Pseudomonadota bacterium]
MRVVICGAGQVGFGIAERLSAEGHDVSVIDVAPGLIANVRDQLDVRGVVGHGSHPDVIAAAGGEDADLLVAVTQADEVNMVACQVAHTLFQVPTKIARVRAQSYLSPMYKHFFTRNEM